MSAYPSPPSPPSHADIIAGGSRRRRRSSVEPPKRRRPTDDPCRCRCRQCPMKERRGEDRARPFLRPFGAKISPHCGAHSSAVALLTRTLRRKTLSRLGSMFGKCEANFKFGQRNSRQQPEVDLSLNTWHCTGKLASIRG